MSVRRMIGLAAGGVIVAVGASLVAGHLRWRSETRTLRERLEAARRPIAPARVDFGALEGLPPPVERYLRAVLRDGQPMVSRAHLRHTGTFDMGDAEARWRPFTSDQLVVMQRPGFDWDARIAMVPGLRVRVHDAYVAGEGVLHAAVFGLVTVAHVRDREAMAAGELLRFFAEAAWYPTALLPGQGVRWAPIDHRSARGTLTDGETTVSMVFEFDESGLIEAVRAERGRMVGDRTESTPWLGRFWNYERRDGVMVPVDGEVAWLLPAGPRPYWRGHLADLRYDTTP